MKKKDDCVSGACVCVCVCLCACDRKDKAGVGTGRAKRQKEGSKGGERREEDDTEMCRLTSLYLSLDDALAVLPVRILMVVKFQHGLL